MSRTSAERQRERSEWIERAESVGPTLEAHSGASAQAKTLVPESVSALEEAGLFRMASPQEVGGYDVHPATQVEAFERLASADVSSGWVAMIQAETPGLAGAHLVRRRRSRHRPSATTSRASLARPIPKESPPHSPTGASDSTVAGRLPAAFVIAAGYSPTRWWSRKTVRDRRQKTACHRWSAQL